MYRAKASGRGRWQIFNAQLREEVVRRLELEHALRDALARDQFELHYQPIVDLETGRVEAIEALVRWQHPERGLVSPADFIPIAEDTGLIVELGEWVLREACTEAAGWFPTDGASPPRVAVNISPRQLADPDLVLAVTMAIAESGLDASRLSLEITESAVMEDFNNAAETILILNRLGIEIALDDFGTGHSSLAQLRRLPPLDVLKIDRAFIADIEHDPHAHALVAAVISMARSLELVAVAEGVETAQQLAILRSLGCPLAQGYLFARPQPAALIQALLSQGHMETAGPETSAPSRARTGT
jgi:EAL domain-containing protein (putative c-di-GMP-specific phosphodiesterase class I)